MYCRNCGKEIAEGAKFCSYCGQPVEAAAQNIGASSTAAAPEPQEIQRESRRAPEPARQQTGSTAASSKPAVSQKDRAETERPRKPVIEGLEWHVEDYPDRNSVGKTEDINFDWNADPAKIPDPVPPTEAKMMAKSQQTQPQTKTTGTVAETLTGADADRAIFGEKKEEKPLSAADRIDKFYTFHSKNEEFQQLLNREYQKVKSGNAIEHELSEAENLAEQRFESRPVNSTMEEFLESEGIVKPYQPKEFESDVLQRIEAQEAEREAKRLEEEARQAAIEEARKEAEAKKKAEAEAEAQRLALIAQKKAEEEAQAAERARKQAEEEARIKAEAERRKIEEAARVRAEEEARIKAEADLRAAQEAAKIRAQQEARLAAEAEARFKAEQEQKRLQAQEAERRLEAERQKLSRQANQAVAEEEVRKVLEQTARMRKEEEEKIKTAVAGLRGGVTAPQEGMPDPQRKEVEEAHQATKNQISEMARARDAFFAELEGDAPAAQPEMTAPQEEPSPVSAGIVADAVAPAVEQADVHTEEVETPVTPEDLFPEQTEERPITGRNTLLSEGNMSDTRIVDKAAVLAGLDDATKVVSKEPIGTESTEDDDFLNSLAGPAVGVAAGVAGAAVGAAAMGMGAESASATEIPEATAGAPMDFRQDIPEDDVDDLLSQFESVSGIDEVQDVPFQDPIIQEAPIQDVLAQQPPMPENPGLDDTVVMARSSSLADAPANDFDHYGEAEAADYLNQQQNQDLSDTRTYAMDDFYGDELDEEEDEENLSKKERKQLAKERRREEKERAKEAKAAAKAQKKNGGDQIVEDLMEDEDAEKGGGKSRIVLKVVLGVLIVVLAVEIVGVGIKWLAPQSKAAEFIDTQLNKVIQLITGEDTQYSVIAAQVRTEPLEDKTDLITAQENKNANNNIKRIVYSSDLGFDQERDGAVSDLVLSQPMTQVEWGRDEDNYPVYYDEEVVGQIIAFESNRVNLMNSGNEKVLKMIDGDAKLYQETAALKNQQSGEFSLLEIGEIRQGGSSYYVWVRETVGNTTTERVYSMYAQKKFVLKMLACYEV